jgi:16S rRNA processing protein RimM
MTEERSDYIVVGRISGLYGVKGWVKVFSHTAPRKNILSYNPWYLKLEGSWRPVQLKEGKPHGKGIIAHLEGCDDRDAAVGLMDVDIAISHTQLQPKAEKEYYWVELIGLEVISAEGQSFGRVDHLIETGANDVLVVKGETERLIPFVMNEVVLDIDLDKKQIHVDWSEEF